jgi:hypothetical protein
MIAATGFAGKSEACRTAKGKGRMFFFEKKNQKTFVPCSVARREHQDIKVFCFFSSEKKVFL